MAEESFQERTEQPTPKRLREAREKGQVARSQELSSAAVLLFGLGALLALGPVLAQNLKQLCILYFGQAASFEITTDTTPGMLLQVSWLFAKAVAPLALLVAVAALAFTYLQVGSVFSFTALELKFDRLDPVRGAKNLISLRSMVLLIKDVLKLLVIGVVGYYAIRKEIPAFLSYPDLDAAQLASVMAAATFKIAFKIVGALAIIAILDFAYQRWDYYKNLRMTRQELLEEFKHTEGNPLIKSRIRAIQRDQARKRMMQDVPKADVVITNPTHIAVALKYDSDRMDAPTVVAKGERLIAEAIKKIAETAGVPVVENQPLARALFKTVEVGMQIPASLYKAVAEVLAYVYSLKGKK